MNVNPQHLSLPLLLATSITLSCADTAGESTTGQRAISQASIDALDLQLDITSGAFRSVATDSVWARSAGPVARFRVAAGPAAGSTISVKVSNLHSEAEVTLLAVDSLNDSAISGCPALAERTSIPCVTALAAVGDPCGAASDCPTGLECTAATCTATALLDVCDTPVFVRDSDDPTALVFDVTAAPCTAKQYGLAPAVIPETVRFGVVGATSSLDRMETAIRRLKEEDVDFIALTGENIESSDSSAIDALETRLSRLGVSIVYVVGEDADRVNSGQYALLKFGPHDHSFSLGSTRFAVFYSAKRELADDGFARLERYVRTLNSQQLADGSGTIIAFTHTPPMDPNGIRDLGFKNHVEGARTMSLLNEFGVRHLFAGRIPASDTGTFGDVAVWLTTSTDSLLASVSEVLVVESKNVVGGDVTVRRIDL